MIEQADVISIELHGTKEDVDGTLCPRRFVLKHVAYWRACKKFISNTLEHPRAALEFLLFSASAYPKIIRMRNSQTLLNDRLVTGVYPNPAPRVVFIKKPPARRSLRRWHPA